MKRIAIICTAFILASCSKEPNYPLTDVAPAAVVEAPIETPQAKNQDAAVTQSRQTAITEAVAKASPAIVSITVTEIVDGTGYPRNSIWEYYFGPVQQEYKSIGSGFIISENGLVVTNEHVAPESAKKIVVAMSDGTTYDAEVVGADHLTDISVLQINSDGAKFPYVEFTDSENILVGEWAIAMGNPFGLFDAGEPSVTVGVVSATNRDFRPDPQDPKVYVDMIQTDASINSGNSGGPLLDSNGKVIGVNTFIYTGGTRGFVGLGFAIPSNRAQKIISQLKESGEVTLDYDMGLKFTQMTYQLVRRYGLPPKPGLLVTEINTDGPAYDSGLLAGDIITRIGNEKVNSEMHAWAILREYEQGEALPVRFFRRNAEYDVEIGLKKSVKQD